MNHLGYGSSTPNVRLTFKRQQRNVSPCNAAPVTPLLHAGEKRSLALDGKGSVKKAKTTHSTKEDLDSYPCPSQIELYWGEIQEKAAQIQVLNQQAKDQHDAASKLQVQFDGLMVQHKELKSQYEQLKPLFNIEAEEKRKAQAAAYQAQAGKRRAEEKAKMLERQVELLKMNHPYPKLIEQNAQLDMRNKELENEMAVNENKVKAAQRDRNIACALSYATVFTAAWNQFR